MRGCAVRIFLTILTVALLVTAPGMRRCAHLNVEAAFAHKSDCPNMVPASEPHAPSQSPADHGDCCPICQMGVGSTFMVLATASPTALEWRPHAQVSRATAQIRLRSQSDGAANQARAPPILS
jgi:hypothetical protein